MQRKQRTSTNISPNLLLLRYMIDNYMTTKGIKQKEICDLIGHSEAVLSRWFNNDDLKPQKRVIEKIAKVLGYRIKRTNEGVYEIEEPVDQTNESPGMYEVKPMRILLERLRDIADQIDHKDYSEEIKDIVFEIYSIHNYTYEELLKAQNQILTKMLNSQRTSNQNK